MIRLPHNFISNWEDLMNHQEITIRDTDEQDMIQNILTLQASLYILRRMVGIDEIHIDTLYKIISKMKLEHSKEFKKDFIDVNEDIDF